MNQKIVLNFIIFFLFINFSYGGNINIDPRGKEEHSTTSKLLKYYQTTVYVCTGEYAYAYHSRPDCPGLSNCKGEIKYTDKYTAINNLRRVPCCRCWSNVIGRCKDDNPYNQNNSNPQFNPYVQQLPIDAMVYAARQKQLEQQRQQQALEELGEALDEYFSPEQRAIRAKERREKKLYRESIKTNRYYPKRNREIEKENKAKQFYVGSDAYNKCKTSKKIWLTSAIVTGAAGAFSYIQANNLASQYAIATNDAASIANKSDLYYTVAPICLSIAGFCSVEFIIKTKKIKNAKVQPISFSPLIIPEGAGLCIKFDF